MYIITEWLKSLSKKKLGLNNSILSIFFVIIFACIILLLFTLISTSSAADQVEILGQATDLGAEKFVWNGTNFAGFYYDFDNDICTEELTLRQQDAILSDQPNSRSNDSNRGIVYTTKAEPNNFSFKEWGQYMVLGFIGEKYFAAYDRNVTKAMKDAGESVSYLYDQSKKSYNLTKYEQISKILIDSSVENTITSDSSLMLEEGYELAIKSIDVDGNKVHVDLLKNGQVVDSKIVKPSITNAKMKDKTYIFKTNLDETEDVVTIAVHFKNAFGSGDTSVAAIDGIFQISETPIYIIKGLQYDKLSIRDVFDDNMTIIMDNKDNPIRLNKNRDILLIKDIYIKIANQNVDSDKPLIYYIYQKHTKPGTYEIRGCVANLSQNFFTYINATFPGFYYDIDNDLGAERISFYPNKTTSMLSDQPDSEDANGNKVRGVVYATEAQPKNFEFGEWGRYEVIGFLGKKYFAAYDNTLTSYPYKTSTNTNLMANEQLAEILIDSNNEITITSDNPLTLADGYELAIKSIDEKGNKVNVELSKDGDVVDQKILQPSIDGATMADKTYYYDEASMGGSNGFVTIAVHFKDAFSGSGDNSAIIDGIFQINDTPTQLKVNQQYGKMSIRNVDSNKLSIVMDNEDQPITLSKNKKILLIEEPNDKNATGDETAIYIKTADQEEIDASHPLRYYIYKNETIEE